MMRGVPPLLCSGVVASMAISTDSELASGHHMDEQAIVIVSEEPASGSSLWSGRFSAHWESGDRQRFKLGPADASVLEAISWGRQRATQVIVLVGGGEERYSAGARNPEPGVLPEWPAHMEIRARPTGTPFDGTQQRREWPVRVEVDAEVRDAELAEDIVRHFASNVRVSAIVSEWRGTELTVMCRYEARSAEDAVGAVWREAERLLRRRYSTLDRSAPAVSAWSEE